MLYITRHDGHCELEPTMQAKRRVCACKRFIVLHEVNLDLFLVLILDPCLQEVVQPPNHHSRYDPSSHFWNDKTQACCCSCQLLLSLLVASSGFVVIS